jgi:outer membrane biogenesis lipoprotein LolB
MQQLRGRGDRLRAALLRAVIAVAIPTLIAGCATPQPPAPVTTQAPDPQAPREWQGRFLVSVQAFDPNQPAETSLGRFELVAAGQALQLALYSPFGQTVASAGRREDGSATLELPDGRRVEAVSLDDLLHRALGYPLPIERLPQWLDRRFDDVIARDSAGTPIEARDSGWHIRMEPRRWELSRPQPTGSLRVLLLLDR